MNCSDNEIWDYRIPKVGGAGEIVNYISPYSRNSSANPDGGRLRGGIPSKEYYEQGLGIQKAVGDDFYNRHRFLCATSSAASELDPDFYGSVNPDGKTVDISVKANPDLTSADKETSEAIKDGLMTPVEVVPNEQTEAIANAEPYIARSRRKEGFCHGGPTGGTSITGLANSDLICSTERFLDTPAERQKSDSFSLVIIAVCVAIVACLFVADYFVRGGGENGSFNQGMSGGYIF